MNELLDRRGLLSFASHGIGAAAFTSLLLRDGVARADRVASDAADPPPHHAPKVKRAIHIVLNGGFSQIDSFDYKPELEKRHGQKFDPGAGIRVEAATSTPGTVLKSPYAWKQHGQSGR